MINYIKKNNEKYKNDVMKKNSKCVFLLKKIGCSFNFLRWSIKQSLTIQDRNHLVATKYQVSKQKQKLKSNYFFGWKHGGHQIVQRQMTWWPPNHPTSNDLVAIRSLSQKQMIQWSPSCRLQFNVEQPSGHRVVFHSPMWSDLVAIKSPSEK